MARRRKQAEVFTGPELVALRERLEQHDRDLVKKIEALLKAPTFGDACAMRDLAQYLVTTRLVLQPDHGTLATAQSLVRLGQGPSSVPNLEACGLDQSDEDDQD